MSNALAEQTNPVVSYEVGATPTSKFAIPFQFWENQDLNVNFNGTTQTGWTATGQGNPQGGELTLAAPVTNGTLVILRYVQEERLTNFPIAGPFRIEALNDEFNHLVAMVKDRRFTSDSNLVTWDDIVGKPDVVVWDEIYPVGTVHLSFSANPPPRGTWELMSAGSFIVGAGGAYPVGTTGGSSETDTTTNVTLTEANLPAHSHGNGSLAVASAQLRADFQIRSVGNASSAKPVYGGENTSVATGSGTSNGLYTETSKTRDRISFVLDHAHSITGSSASVGSGQSFATGKVVPTIPPYIAAYMWRRTA